MPKKGSDGGKIKKIKCDGLSKAPTTDDLKPTSHERIRTNPGGAIKQSSITHQLLKTKPAKTMKQIIATIIKNQVSSNSIEAHTLQQKSKFGEKQNQKITYSSCEAFYLIQQSKIQISDLKNKQLTKIQLLKKFCASDKNFQAKYQVFKDLREKGYIVKTALKFGSDFRVYEKGKPNSHSKWLCHVTQENYPLKWQDFAAKNRVAHSTKKNLLVAVIDEENKVSYYETKWTQP